MILNTLKTNELPYVPNRPYHMRSKHLHFAMDGSLARNTQWGYAD